MCFSNSFKGRICVFVVFAFGVMLLVGSTLVSAADHSMFQHVAVLSHNGMVKGVETGGSGVDTNIRLSQSAQGLSIFLEAIESSGQEISSINPDELLIIANTYLSEVYTDVELVYETTDASAEHTFALLLSTSSSTTSNSVVLGTNFHDWMNAPAFAEGPIANRDLISDETTMAPGNDCTDSDRCTGGTCTSVSFCTVGIYCTSHKECTRQGSCTHGNSCTSGDACTSNFPACTSGPYCTYSTNCTVAQCTNGPTCSDGAVCTTGPNCTTGLWCTQLHQLCGDQSGVQNLSAGEKQHFVASLPFFAIGILWLFRVHLNSNNEKAS